MNQKIEDDTQKADDHILVCLSAAPSNLKIIDTAAKMANALQAHFTALYVQTGTKAEAALWPPDSPVRSNLQTPGNTSHSRPLPYPAGSRQNS